MTPPLLVRPGTLPHRITPQKEYRGCAASQIHELRNEVVEELTTEEVRKTVLGRVLHSSKTPGTEEI
jgi:hypothetical protein